MISFKKIDLKMFFAFRFTN